jgi:ADP-heptose:LPS heptosyltransferase
MGFGDEIMAAGEAERLFRMDPTRPVAICECNGTPRWSEVWEHNPAIATPAYVKQKAPVQKIINGVGCRPYIRYPFTAARGMKFTDWRARDHVGRLYLTADELHLGQQLRAEMGPFLVIEPDVKPASTPNKKWGLDRFADVVRALPELRWLRVHGPDCPEWSVVANVQVRTFRQACGILAASEGYVGTEGGYHHAAAALNKPAVVIFGGYISPKTTGYETHQNLCDKGPGSPCGKWRQCGHCLAAMAKITPERVVQAVREMLGMAEEQAS